MTTSDTASADAFLTDQAASNLIRTHIASDEPSLIGRLGANELAAVLHHLSVRRDARSIRRGLLYAARRPRASWSEGSAAALIHDLTNNAGLFPADPETFERFAELMLDAMPAIDVLGSWLAGEERVRPYLRGAARVSLRDLEPYYHRKPWSEALAGRKVLVVHPFAQSIEAQYARRKLLFDDPRVLPDFDLTVIPAVQSIAGTSTSYSTWFDAYRHMCEQMEKVSFDIAILGCGAYGLPLAAHAKRIGKKGVHLGGSVQILFGIKGKRWDGHEVISRLYNEHWVRPREDERPPNFREVEDGCYW